MRLFGCIDGATTGTDESELFDAGAASLEARRLIAHSSAPAFLIDRQGKVAGSNRALEELLGYEVGGTAGLSCEQLLQARLPGGTALCCQNCAVFAGFRECQPSSVGECHIVRKDGSLTRVRISSVAVAASGLLAIIFLHALG